MSRARDLPLAQLALLAIGVIGIGLAMVAGRSDAVGAVLDPGWPVAGLLGAAAGLLGLVVLLQAVQRVADAASEPRALIRGIRLLFLAVAAFAAAGGWILGIPVAIVAALIIAAVDVIETTFLLVVTAARGEDGDRPTEG